MPIEIKREYVPLRSYCNTRAGEITVKVVLKVLSKINISSKKILRRNEENTKESHQTKILERQCPVCWFLLSFKCSKRLV